MIDRLYWKDIMKQHEEVILAIQLLESPIPSPAAAPSQKASSGNILGTRRGIIDPLVSKRPEKI